MGILVGEADSALHRLQFWDAGLFCVKCVTVRCETILHHCCSLGVGYFAHRKPVEQH